MAVGLTLVEPVADEDVNVPGVMAMLVAPEVAQVSVLLEPEEMLSGFTAKEEIVGTEPFPVDEPEETAALQPAKPTHTNRENPNA